MTERTKWTITGVMLAIMLAIMGAMAPPKTAPQKQAAKLEPQQESVGQYICRTDPRSCQAFENLMKDTARAQDGMPAWQRSILRSEERANLDRMYPR